ncbi:MAG: NAD(+) synthase [Kiritimatiellia bacterium]
MSHRLYIARTLQNSIVARLAELRRDGVVLGLSGGVDSAVVAALCVRAVGAERVLALLLPERDSDPVHRRHALMLARKLSIEARVRVLTPVLKHFAVFCYSPLRFFPRILQEKLARFFYRYRTEKTGRTPYMESLEGPGNELYALRLRKANACYRLKHRLRMVELYCAAEEENRLVVGAANKTEWMTGFFVKFGCDHIPDCMPLMSLYKTQVFELARFLDLPSEIIAKAPSPDVIPGITDEFAIGIPYAKLDLVLLGLEKGLPEEQIAAEADVTRETVGTVKAAVRLSAHMRVPIT